MKTNKPQFFPQGILAGYSEALHVTTCSPTWMECSVSMWKPGQLEKLQCNIFLLGTALPKIWYIENCCVKINSPRLSFCDLLSSIPHYSMFRFGGGVIFKALHLMLYFHIKLIISKPLHKQCFRSVISGLGKCSQTAFIVISNHMLQINWKSWTNLLCKTKSQSCMCQCMYMCIHTWVCLWVFCWVNSRLFIDLLSLSPTAQSRADTKGRCSLSIMAFNECVWILKHHLVSKI